MAWLITSVDQPCFPRISVHAKQVTRKQRCFIPTGTGADFQY
jgi:hypothetical protein